MSFFDIESKIFTFEELLNRLQVDGNTTSFVIWRETDLFGIHNYPIKIDLPCLFFCWNGEMEVEINLQSNLFNNRHILCITIPSAVRILRRSNDFQCVGILFSKEYWKQLLFQERGLSPIAALHTLIDVSKETLSLFARFYELLCLCSDDPDNPNPNETLHPLLTGLLYQLKNISVQQILATPPATHGEQLFHSFLDTLQQNYARHRRVSFYASALSLSPRHLTTVIRQVSGKSASRWIEEYVILEAQILLRNTDKTIKEIAYTLNFNDQSLFTKYFSRIVGIPPEQYRKLK